MSTTLLSAFRMTSAITIAVAARWVGAGELMPYVPPMAQVAAQVANAPPAAAANAVTITVAPAVYQQFAQQVRSLTAAQREELRRRLDRSHDEAVAAGDASRELHYHRLLDILEKRP